MPATDIDTHRQLNTLEDHGRPHATLRHVIVSAAVVVAVGLALFFGWRMLSTPSTPVGTTQIRAQLGSLAPDFELRDINTGKMVKLSELRGRPVWVNFWATWCPPCAEEMPEMQKLYNQYKQSDLALLGVDVQENEEAVRKFTGGRFNWTFLLDTDGKVVDRYLVGGLPTHFFIDKDGIIRAIYMGALSPDSGMSQDMKVDFHQYLSMIMGE
ncbi:MAG: hypothetical protein QOH93_1818 [Chloroflexia bacterium]|jgi:thiol-disulfide isomerase/thioredoxin|nr:hypothetical protein [Chloroflexia bacterium]